MGQALCNAAQAGEILTGSSRIGFQALLNAASHQKLHCQAGMHTVRNHVTGCLALMTLALETLPLPDVHIATQPQCTSERHQQQTDHHLTKH